MRASAALRESDISNLNSFNEKNKTMSTSNRQQLVSAAALNKSQLPSRPNLDFSTLAKPSKEEEDGYMEENEDDEENEDEERTFATRGEKQTSNKLGAD